MPGPLYELAARQILRALRGRRSQLAFSRRLGFRSNVSAKWESGQRMPTAVEALRHSQRVGVDVKSTLKRFHATTAPVMERLDEKHAAAWLSALRGAQSINDIAKRSGLSRFSVGRFLVGRSEPRLPQFLQLIDVLTGRIDAFVDAWVGIEQVPVLLARHQRTLAARKALLEEPLCLAVMCLLDTVALERTASEQVTLLSTSLEKSRSFIERCMYTLLSAGAIRLDAGRYLVSGAMTLDADLDPGQQREVRAYWTRFAHHRLRVPRDDDLCSYNIFSISRDDFANVQRLQREFFRNVRALIAASSPTEIAGVLIIHSLALTPGMEQAGGR